MHILTVMPDHAHILATPLQAQPWQWYSLPEILQSVKRASSRAINARHGRRGTLWEPEGMDRIVRNDEEYEEKFDHILHNAVRRGLCADPFGWDGLWCEGMPIETIVTSKRRRPAARHRPTYIPADVLVQRRRDLPHWELGGSTYFLTFREL